MNTALTVYVFGAIFSFSYIAAWAKYWEQRINGWVVFAVIIITFAWPFALPNFIVYTQRPGGETDNE